MEEMLKWNCFHKKRWLTRLKWQEDVSYYHAKAKLFVRFEFMIPTVKVKAKAKAKVKVKKSEFDK